MNLSDKILEQAAKLAPMRDELEKLEKSLSDVTDGYDPESEDDETSIEQIEELTKQINELRPQVEAADSRLKALRSAEQELAKKAVAKPPVGSNVIPQLKKDPTQDHQPGDYFMRIALVKALAHQLQEPEDAIFQDRYGSDEATKAIFNWSKKTAVAAADTTTAGWAAELVRNDMRGFLDMLKNTSVGAAIATRAMLLNFAGAGTVTIPRINQIDPAATEPAWVGEGGHIPLQQFSFGSTTLSRYKLASIVPMTMELAEQSTPQAEAIFRSAMQEAYTIMLDRAMLSNAAAVAGVRPAGLLAGVTNAATGQITPDGTGGYASVIADVTAMLAYMSTNGVGQRPVLVLSDQDYIGLGALLNPLGQLVFRDEVSGGRLLGVEVVHSRNVPAGTAIMVDAAAIAIALDGPRFMVSQEATLTMADAGGTAPTQAGTDATPGAVGTAGQVPPDSGIKVSGNTGASTTGYTAVNMFQTYSQAIRGIWPTSWGLMRNNVVASVVTTGWT